MSSHDEFGAAPTIAAAMVARPVMTLGKVKLTPTYQADSKPGVAPSLLLAASQGRAPMTLGKVKLTPSASPAYTPVSKGSNSSALYTASLVKARPSGIIVAPAGRPLPSYAPSVYSPTEPIRTISAPYTGGVGQGVSPESWDGGEAEMETPSPAIDQRAATERTPLATLTPSPAAAREPPATLWTRILAFFGLAPKEVRVSGESFELRDMVESVIRRGRNGDQNAMALMALVRQNAMKGHSRAQQSYDLMCEYVRANPVLPASNLQIGSEGVYSDGVALSHGARLTDSRLRGMLSSFDAGRQRGIRFGLEGGIHPASSVRMGRIIREARRLQAVRMASSPISKFSVDAGWELGE